MISKNWKFGLRMFPTVGKTLVPERLELASRVGNPAFSTAMSTQLKARAEAVMPGGVNSPVRAFKSVGGNPIFARRAGGAVLETTDDQILIDFCMSFGPSILGHAHPEISEAVARAVRDGATFAVTTLAEIEMAEAIRAAVPSMERVRMVSSGTEAVMSAIRLARGFTGRNKILKFTGCYHGHTDSMLVQAGSGVAGLATTSSAGVPSSIAADTLVARYNSQENVLAIFRQHAADIAAIIVEPVAANVGLMLPDPGFLQFLREITKSANALLIFDEVISGFRLCYGGYQNICKITPDLTTLGKIIGGGLPVGAIGGRADIMEKLAPLGDVYQAGTLSGNPVSMAAGLAQLRVLKRLDPYAKMEERTIALVQLIKQAAAESKIPLQVPHIGSIFSLFFTDKPVRDFSDVMGTKKELYVKLFHALLKRGVYLPPSPFEVCFLSAAHDEGILRRAGMAWFEAVRELKS
jgi:glutamate-1-semialdehyde 2,1-aminomutase